MSTEAPTAPGNLDIGDTVELRDDGRCRGLGTVVGSIGELVYVLFLSGSVLVQAERLRLVRSVGVSPCPRCGGTGYLGGTVYRPRFVKCDQCGGSGDKPAEPR